jgi:hypothetical protein
MLTYFPPSSAKYLMAQSKKKCLKIFSLILNIAFEGKDEINPMWVSFSHEDG